MYNLVICTVLADLLYLVALVCCSSMLYKHKLWPPCFTINLKVDVLNLAFQRWVLVH